MLMRSLNLLAGTAIVLAIMSFGKAPASNELAVSGKYGVCAYENNMPAYLELTLNENHTFHYTDKTNPEKPIDTKGKWVLNKNMIVLKDYQSLFPIHSSWKIDKGTKCLKSKRGMTFYRLCNLGACSQE